MRVAVCIKQVPDTETKIKLKPDASGIDATGIKWVMNPYDEFAVEEGIKLREGGKATQVIVFSVGPKARVVETLRTALAMGADEGVAVDAPEDLDPSLTAKALAKAIKAEGEFGLVLTGKLAIDDNLASVGQMLAEALQLPHATVVSKLEVGDSLTAEREVEGGSKEILSLQKPALIGANKGLNTPRYASLPGIMKAKKKTLKEHSLASLGVDASQAKVKHVAFALPADKPPVKMLEGDAATQAKSLAGFLRNEAKVL
jgi:electron transfer flavoprotein beta subunit